MEEEELDEISWERQMISGEQSEMGEKGLGTEKILTAEDVQAG